MNDNNHADDEESDKYKYDNNNIDGNDNDVLITITKEYFASYLVISFILVCNHLRGSGK